MRGKYVVILNFETQTIDVLSLDNLPQGGDIELFIEDTLDYSLSNCEWMVTNDIIPKHLNFNKAHGTE